ncbi:MAG: hypothetical protein N2Z22_12205, partial [Turneriella sp.]|nr:hypothetical protein [Turneriella sp.]
MLNWKSDCMLKPLLCQLGAFLVATVVCVQPTFSATHSDGAITLQINNPIFDSKAAALMAKIREKYQLESLQQIAKGTSTAQSLATMGAGTSYASGNHVFIVGGGMGLALNATNQTLGQMLRSASELGGDTLPRFGLGMQASAMVGANLSLLPGIRYLGPFELSRITVLANFLDVRNNSVSGLSLSATVAGLHVQYQLSRPRRTGPLVYGEILWVVGVDYSRLNARYDSTVGKALTPITVGGGTPGDPQLTFT